MPTPLHCAGMDAWRWFTGHIELISLVIGLAGIPALIFSIQDRRQKAKTLDWEVTTDEAIVAARPHGATRRLDVRWDRVPLSRPRLVVIRIKNTGGQAIRHDDYSDRTAWPITISIPGSKIRDGTITDGSLDVPKGPEQAPLVDPLSETGDVVIDPMLLNAKDWFDIQLIVDGDSGKPLVSARFAGQSRPMRNTVAVKATHTRRLAGLTTLLMGIILAGMAVVVFLYPTREGSPWFALLPLTFAVVWAGLGLLIIKDVRD